MHQLLLHAYEQRQDPIRIAIVGTGWLGSGLARELVRMPKVQPVLLIDKEIELARTTYREMGVPDDQVGAPGSGKPYAVSTDLDVIKAVGPLEIVFEATGHMVAGAHVGTTAIDMGAHFVTGACELDACLGLALHQRARAKGVLYSNSDGDQPVVLKRMLDEIIAWGFEPKVVGNCKGFLDIDQDPKGVVPWVPDHQDLYKVVAMADGSKQSEEMVCLGNVFGYHPTRRGMHGPRVTKGSMVEEFDKILDLASFEGTGLDFTQGITGVNEGAGVFVIARRDDPHSIADMKFLKKGEGPNYLFFRDHHLCYYELSATILQVALFQQPVFAPRGRFVDVMTLAKRDLQPGQDLDRVGGFDDYGEVERADLVSEHGYLPYGIAEYVTKVNRAIPKGDPICMADVELEDNAATRLRREVDALPVNEFLF